MLWNNLISFLISFRVVNERYSDPSLYRGSCFAPSVHRGFSIFNAHILFFPISPSPSPYYMSVCYLININILFTCLKLLFFNVLMIPFAFIGLYIHLLALHIHYMTLSCVILYMTLFCGFSLISRPGLVPIIRDKWESTAISFLSCRTCHFKAREIVIHRPCWGRSGSYDRNILHSKRGKLFPDHVEDLQEATIKIFVVF